MSCCKSEQKQEAPAVVTAPATPDVAPEKPKTEGCCEPKQQERKKEKCGCEC
jgi:hypothetical protein